MKILQTFFSFVEIQTKLASVMPFLAGLAYAFHLTGAINVRSSLIYLAAALLFDMTVTAINNHKDKRETKSAPHFPRAISLAIIFAMAIGAGALGLCLARLHGLAVLLAGMLCFAAGIAYTFGPAPISKSPYGEAVSGFVMGFVIMFIVVSINAPAVPMVDIAFLDQWRQMSIHVNWSNLLALALVSLPAVCAIANIMLANNICDMEADKETRYTMARHIGAKNALRLFAALYVAAYLAVLAASVLRIAPLWSLVTLAAVWPVRENVRRFFRKQSKQETFPLAVKNFLLIMAPFAATMALGSFLEGR